MAVTEDISTMAHLMRRVGFGATRSRLESLAEGGYEQTVEWLLNPGEGPAIDEYELYRYIPMAEDSRYFINAQVQWLYRMVHTRFPLQEKMALFWHHVFATGNDKVGSGSEMATMIGGFRQDGMGNYRDIVMSLARSPAMIFWLDNQENHKRAPNENWGRELMELFSLGVGNYTEKDVFECARAFTGWTFADKVPTPWGNVPWRFEYRPEDHDNGEKTFLGVTGNLNGQDIIDILLQQPACTRFMMRHLYNFFVADEPEVPKWPGEPPRDPDAISLLSETWVGCSFEMKPVLRVLFNSDFFKEAKYEKVKSPAEVVAGTLILTGDLRGPDPAWITVAEEPASMGQDLFTPPSVEGWHTGKEWINSGALINRVNFVADRFRNTSLPSVQDIISRVATRDPHNGTSMSAAELVDRCLEVIGPLTLGKETRQELLSHVEGEGPVTWGTDDEDPSFSHRVGDLLGLIVGTREYQFG